MFTGIITDLGTVQKAEGGRFSIASSFDPAKVAIGASIACDGCCLTVVSVEQTGSGCIFSVDVSDETMRCTTLGEWTAGRRVNLEPSLKLGDEMGGHLVTGHVDGLARVVSITPEGTSSRFEFECNSALARYIAPKGSVSLNGTSLTVNEVSSSRFTINLIPHTLSVTSWGQISAGMAINLEVDLIARYVARLVQPDAEVPSEGRTFPSEPASGKL
jgi:riboflavin synthase